MQSPDLITHMVIPEVTNLSISDTKKTKTQFSLDDTLRKKFSNSDTIRKKFSIGDTIEK